MGGGGGMDASFPLPLDDGEVGGGGGGGGGNKGV